MDLSSGNTDPLFNTPIVVPIGVNHAMFASGEMPPLVEIEDIKTDLDDAVGKTMIADAAAAFMVYHTEPRVDIQHLIFSYKCYMYVT